MADKKISQLTNASTPLAGTEVLPIVQSSATVKVAANDLTVKNVRSNATTGILQIAGPAAAATRTMTVPDANFTVARTDAAQSFSGVQTFSSKIIAASAQTLATTVSLSSTPTTLFSISGDAAVYYVSVAGGLGNIDAFSAFAIILFDRSNSKIMLSTQGTQVVISLSGNDVQAVNNFTSAVAYWGYFRQTLE